MNEFPFLSFSLLSVLEDQLGSDFPWIPPHPSPVVFDVLAGSRPRKTWYPSVSVIPEDGAFQTSPPSSILWFILLNRGPSSQTKGLKVEQE